MPDAIIRIENKKAKDLFTIYSYCSKGITKILLKETKIITRKNNLA